MGADYTRADVGRAAQVCRQVAADIALDDQDLLPLCTKSIPGLLETAGKLEALVVAAEVAEPERTGKGGPTRLPPEKVG